MYIGTSLVGIGTTTPSALLSITADQTNIGFYLAGNSLNTLDLFRISTSTASATSTAIVIDANGRMGVGTSSPYATLSVSGLTASGYFNADWLTSTSTFKGGLSVGNNAAFSVNQAATANSLTVAANGNVGIGTINPGGIAPGAASPPGYTAGRVLEIGGSDNYDAGIFLRNLTGNVGIDIWSSSGNARGFFDSRYDSASIESFNFRTRTAGTPVNALTILGNGNIGIGSSTPAAKLSINAPLNALGFYLAGYAANTSDLFRISTSTASATSTAFVIDANGKVGIGTSSPTYALSVVGSAQLGTGDEAMRIASTGYVGIGTSSPAYKLDVAAGWVNSVSGYKTNFADYAEYFWTKDTDLQSGEAVCVDITRSNAVKRCSRGEDPNIMGIVSTNPAIIGNNSFAKDNDVNYKIIGLLGQVPARASAENGPIRPGDSLTSASSTPGYLMRANAGDSTVGVALESLNSPQPSLNIREGEIPPLNLRGGEGELNTTGVINVLISRRNKSLTVEQVEEQVTQRIANMKIEDEVNILVASAVSKLNLEDQIGAIVDPKLLAMKDEFRQNLEASASNMAALNDKIFTFYGEFGRYASSTSQAVIDIYSAVGNISDKFKNILSGADGGLKIGNNISTSTPSVAVVEISALSNDKPAFVISQSGGGKIAQFSAGDVQIMTVSQDGRVTVVGELFVDGRIMVCSNGACSDALNSAVDQTQGDMGVEGKVVAGGFENYCPDMFVWVPGSAKYGTMPGFCIMENNSPQPSLNIREGEIPPLNLRGGEGELNLPWTNLSLGEAQMACQQMGSAYHLLSDNEWLTLAENILRVPANDAEPLLDGLQLNDGTASSTSLFVLSNGNKIYGLAAAVGEWIDQTVLAAGLPVPLSDDWQEYSAMADFKGFNIAPPYFLDSLNGIGKIKTGSADGAPLRAFVRGQGGIFGLDLTHAPTDLSAGIGFRCAK